MYPRETIIFTVRGSFTSAFLRNMFPMLNVSTNEGNVAKQKCEQRRDETSSTAGGGGGGGRCQTQPRKKPYTQSTRAHAQEGKECSQSRCSNKKGRGCSKKNRKKKRKKKDHEPAAHFSRGNVEVVDVDDPRSLFAHLVQTRTEPTGQTKL